MEPNKRQFRESPSKAAPEPKRVTRASARNTPPATQTSSSSRNAVASSSRSTRSRSGLASSAAPVQDEEMDLDDEEAGDGEAEDEGNEELEDQENEMAVAPEDYLANLDAFRDEELSFAEFEQEVLEQRAQELEEFYEITYPEIDRTQVFEMHSSNLIRAYKVSLFHVVKVALALRGLPCDGWAEKRKGSKEVNYEAVQRGLWLMMLGWEPLILQHVIEGNLPRANATNPVLESLLTEMYQAGTRFKPCIYANYLVNADGISPTPREINVMLEAAELYIRGFGKIDEESAELAAEIDRAMSASKSNNRAGERRYIEIAAHVEVTTKWVECVRLRLSTLAQDHPLERPLSEVGYATHGKDRLKSHATHRSSNYLMNLTEAICLVQFPRYRIAQYILAYTINLQDASYAEIMASRMALCYTSVGGGFSHHAAGQSYAAAERVEKDYYLKMQKEMFSSASFVARRRHEYRRMVDHSNVFRNEALQSQKFQEKMGRNEEDLTRSEEEIEKCTATALEANQQLSSEIDAWANLVEEFGGMEWIDK